MIVWCVRSNVSKWQCLYTSNTKTKEVQLEATNLLSGQEHLEESKECSFWPRVNSTKTCVFPLVVCPTKTKCHNWIHNTFTNTTYVQHLKLRSSLKPMHYTKNMALWLTFLWLCLKPSCSCVRQWLCHFSN